MYKEGGHEKSWRRGVSMIKTLWMKLSNNSNENHLAGVGGTFLRSNENFFLKTRLVPSGPASTGVARAQSLLTPASYPQDPPQDLKTSGEWNTASAPIQSRGT